MRMNHLDFAFESSLVEWMGNRPVVASPAVLCRRMAVVESEGPRAHHLGLMINLLQGIIRTINHWIDAPQRVALLGEASVVACCIREGAYQSRNSSNIGAIWAIAMSVGDRLNTRGISFTDHLGLQSTLGSSLGGLT